MDVWNRAEEQFGALRSAYGSNGCHLLVINSKPVKSKAGLANDAGLLPAPDPWLRFLPRKSSKVNFLLLVFTCFP